MLTGIIIVTIVKSRSKVGTQVDNRRLSTMTSKDRKFAKNAIMLNIFSFMFQFPFICLTIVSSNNSDTAAQILFFATLGLQLLDNASLFFINMGFNSIFYSEFLVMIWVRKDQESSIRRHTNTNVQVIQVAERKGTLPSVSFRKPTIPTIH